MARKQLSGQNQNNTPITNVPAPTNGGDAANKTYVDTAVSGKRDTLAGSVNRVYVTGSSGTDSEVSYTSSDSSSTMMYRDSSGRTSVTSGNTDSNAVNLGQMNTALSAKLGTQPGNAVAYTNNAAGAFSALPYTTSSTPVTLALRGSGGTIDVGNPTSDVHAVTRGWAKVELDKKLTLIDDKVGRANLLMSPESTTNAVIIPYYMNDIAYNDKRGGAVRVYVDGVDKTSTYASTLPNLFTPDASTVRVTETATTIVFEVDCCKLFRYGTRIGYAGYEGWRGRDCLLETYSIANAQWEVAATITDASYGEYMKGVPGNGAAGFDKIRYTFSNFNNAGDKRFGQLMVSSYNGDLGSGPFMPRGGGQLYGAIDMGSNKITTLTTPTSEFDAANKSYVDTADATKQDALVSGANIKTVNGNTLLGSGDLVISGGAGAVDSVNTQTGIVVLDADDISDTSTTNKFATAAEKSRIAAITDADYKNSNTTKTQVGLSNVDNTSDANKPVSTAQQTALNLKANSASPTFTGTVSGITAAMVGAPSGSGTSSGTNTGDQTTITGNAGTATALQTARTIAGVSFKGTANIAIASTDLSNSSSIVLTTGTQTLASKTLTAPVLSGTVTGTYTLGGTPTFPSTVVSTTGTQTLTNKRITKRVTSPALASNVYTIAGDTTDTAKISTAPTANFTIANPTGTPTDDQKLEIVISSGATGYVPTFGSVFIGSTDIPLPSTALTPSKRTRLGFVYESTLSKYVLIAKVEY